MRPRPWHHRGAAEVARADRQVVDEPIGGAHRDHRAMAATLKRALGDALRELEVLSPSELVEQRYQKLMSYGRYRRRRPRGLPPPGAVRANPGGLSPRLRPSTIDGIPSAELLPEPPPRSPSRLASARAARVCCALSGGADRWCCSRSCAGCSRAFGFDPVAAHVDHGLSPSSCRAARTA